MDIKGLTVAQLRQDIIMMVGEQLNLAVGPLGEVELKKLAELNAKTHRYTLEYIERARR